MAVPLQHVSCYIFENKYCRNVTGGALFLTLCKILKPTLSLPTPAPDQVINGHNIHT